MTNLENYSLYYEPVFFDSFKKETKIVDIVFSHKEEVRNEDINKEQISFIINFEMIKESKYYKFIEAMKNKTEFSLILAPNIEIQIYDNIFIYYEDFMPGKHSKFSIKFKIHKNLI